MERRIIAITVFSLFIGSALLQHQVESRVSAQSEKADCAPIAPPPCQNRASPAVLQIVPDSSAASNKRKLSRKRFFLSPCPFNLSSSINVTTAPSLRTYYERAGASAQLVKWLEENHCQSIYCRPLTIDDVKCEGAEAARCVPEFATAYRNALAGLNGDAALALKMITTYPPLAESKLRIGFHEARTQWLTNALAKLESTANNTYKIRTTITDKDGIGFFYDLCPGSYYLSSVGPIDVDGVDFVWESSRPVRVEGPPEVKTATRVTLAFPPNKDKKNYFVARPLADFAQKPSSQ